MLTILLQWTILSLDLLMVHIYFYISDGPTFIHFITLLRWKREEISLLVYADLHESSCFLSSLWSVKTLSGCEPPTTLRCSCSVLLSQWPLPNLLSLIPKSPFSSSHLCLLFSLSLLVMFLNVFTIVLMEFQELMEISTYI